MRQRRPVMPNRTALRAEPESAITRLPAVCARCGERFVPTGLRQRYCRPSCRRGDNTQQPDLFG
jgi:hypothetical protein